MRKVYQLDEHFPTGEATVQPILLWGADGRPLRERVTSKTASEASEYIKSVTPRPGKSIVLVLALGAYETYDCNRNGDGFNEHAYRPGVRPTCGCCTAGDAWVTSAETLPQHYRTFETNATVFKHHVNKDPNKNFGDVLKAFWNPYMHRVELLLGVDNEKAPDIVERIADGEYPAVSMGCRIKYDVCNICGHRAPTRAQYCDHLKFNLRQVTPGGLRAAALNPAPLFFDISFVVRPADQTGYMLKKVAHVYEVKSSAELGEYVDRVDEKRAALQKISDIDKVIRGIAVDHKVSPLSETEARNIEHYRDAVMPAVRRMPEMDDGTLKSLAVHPVADVLATLSTAGVILTTPEFIRLIIEKLAPGTPVPAEALDTAVALQGQVFDLFAQNPQLLDQLTGTGMFDSSASHVDPEIGRKAERYLEKRSTISDYLSRKLIPPDYREEEPAWTDALTVTDPGTGARYQTTRGAARDAHDDIAKRQLGKMLGGSLLLAGAHKVVSAGLPKAYRPLSLGTAGLLGYTHLRPDFGPQYMTDEGVAIPATTEMRQVRTAALRGTALPVLGAAALVAGLSHDYQSRLSRGDRVGDPDAPFHRRLFDKVEQYHHNHPALAFLSNLGLYGLGRDAIGKFASGDSVTEQYNDGVHLPDVDVDRVAEKLGALLIR